MLGLGTAITASSGADVTGVVPPSYLWTSSDLSDYGVSGDDTLTLGSTEVDGLDNYLILTQNTDAGSALDPTVTLSASSSLDVNTNTFSTGRFTLTAKFLRPSGDTYNGFNLKIIEQNTSTALDNTTITSGITTGEWKTVTAEADADGTGIRFSFSIYDPGTEPSTGEKMYITDLKLSHSDGTVLHQRGPSF